jgi:hypothetical protein
MQPAVASDGVNQFLVVTWTSFTGSPNNFDLFAQRYINMSASSCRRWPRRLSMRRSR